MNIAAIPNKFGITKASLKEGLKLGAGAAAGFMAAAKAPAILGKVPGYNRLPALAQLAATGVVGVALGAVVAKRLDKAVGTGLAAGVVGASVTGVVAHFRAAPTVQKAVEGLMGLSGGGGGLALYGVGTPDMGAARMFAGATVEFEDKNGPMAGATVQFEESPGFASALA